mmetsp:Transcript_69136/g.218706  ORF Transcript_69136/g.218706 Transcript_69136/m.218706 type:complete len:216 (+) Transcript_69136:943-1590(+)
MLRIRGHDGGRQLPDGVPHRGRCRQLRNAAPDRAAQGELAPGASRPREGEDGSGQPGHHCVPGPARAHGNGCGLRAAVDPPHHRPEHLCGCMRADSHRVGPCGQERGAGHHHRARVLGPGARLREQPAARGTSQQHHRGGPRAALAQRCPRRARQRAALPGLAYCAGTSRHHSPGDDQTDLQVGRRRPRDAPLLRRGGAGRFALPGGHFGVCVCE